MTVADAHDSRSEAVLELAHVTKRFGSILALDDVSFTLRPGTVHALLGENGAGKTTLLRVAFGMAGLDEGTMRLRGSAARFASPADAIAAGIGMVHQHFSLVPSMTVAENIALGGRGRVRRTDIVATVRRIAAATGFSLDPDARIDTLSVGAQQRVEIAKALARQARILVLDEPTAVLAPSEAEELLDWLRDFAKQGNAAVLITHRLREALSVADDVTVLRHGRVVHAGRATNASQASLTSAMIGKDVATVVPASAPRSASTAGVVFRADALSVADEQGTVRVHNAHFAVYAGEIVGVVGVEGAGQRELLRALAGRRRATSGAVTHPIGVGFIPEDRHRDAVLLDRPLHENVALRSAGTRHGTIGWAAARVHAEALMHSYDVRAPDARTSMRSLSGGNQQKLVLARELDESLRPSEGTPAIVAENPTRGLDVRATIDVHARLRAARDGGAAVIVYSSDLDEVLLLASRVLVAYAGSIREVPTDRDAVGRAMLGIS